MTNTEGQRATISFTTLLRGLAPLVLLAALVWTFLTYGPLGIFTEAFPPIEELSVQRIVLPAAGKIQVQVVNGGPDPVTVAQVLVDEAYWSHSITPSRTIHRLGQATITIPYPWVEGESHEIMLITDSGVTFSDEIEVATLSPTPNITYLVTFTLLGLYVGVIPVGLGLLWYPFLRRIKHHWMNFLLASTIGLLLFLGVDTVDEALDIANEQLPDAFQGLALITTGVLGTFLALDAFGKWASTKNNAESESRSRLVLSYLIALGIGMHNLGEGLAIGAAYSVGEIALGGFLVLGFMLHNTTEGLAILAPISRDRPLLRHLMAFGAIAGGPTIVGTWIGGFTYSPLWATLFLAMGAGAIFQVIYEICRLIQRQRDGIMSMLNTAGLLTGMVIMYVTGLLIAA